MFAPALVWQRLHRPRRGSRKRSRPRPRLAPREGQRQGEVGLATQREHERLEGVQLGVRRQAEVDSGYAIQGPGEVLDDGAEREEPERAIRAAVPRPPGAGFFGARHGGAQGEHVIDAAEDPRPVEAVEVLLDQRELAKELRVLELCERGVELGHEEGVARREGGDEGGVQREVVLRRMAGGAGPPVAAEGLLGEQHGPPRDEVRIESGGTDPGLAGDGERQGQNGDGDDADREARHERRPG